MKNNSNIKDYILLVIGSILVGTLYFHWMDKLSTESDKVIQYKKTIDSLQNQIVLNNIKINTLDSIKNTLDSQVIENKKQLSNIANKANYYRRKYNEEHSRIIDLSNDAIISEFSAIFDYD